MDHIFYQINGKDEFCLVSGDANARRRIVFIAPLFDEMNRMRRVLVSAMRQLAAQGHYCALPDLPGCNESQADLAAQDLNIWRDAAAAAAAAIGATHIASVRGGALIDDGAAHLPHWRLSPVKGSMILKTMLRTRLAGDKEAGLTTTMEGLLAQARTAPIELAGNLIGPAMLASLETAETVLMPNASTVVPGEGSGDITGGALWLRAEPQDDPALTASIAQSIGRWSASCGR